MTGKVDQELGWSEDQLRAMEMVDAETVNSQGEKETQVGVPISVLLVKASLQAGATKLVLVADDGYSAEISLEDLEACPTCVVSFRNQGGLRTAMPGMPGMLHVRGLVEIRVE